MKKQTWYTLIGVVAIGSALALWVSRAEEKPSAPANQPAASTPAEPVAATGTGPGVGPDLQVPRSSAPSSGQRGHSISVSSTTSNSAALYSGGSSDTYMYLNTNPNLVGATNVGTYHCNMLAPKACTNWSGIVTIPSNQPTGQNYFITVCDKPNAVTEANENNNTNYVGITVNP